MRRVWVIAVFVGIAALWASAATPEDVSNEMETALQAVAAADKPVDAFNAYRALFRSIIPKDFRFLKQSKDPGIALFAAWESALKVAGHEQRLAKRRGDDEPEHLALQERLEFERLVGFIEGRLRVRAPHWWQEPFQYCFHRACIGNPISPNPPEDYESRVERIDRQAFRAIDSQELGLKSKDDSLLGRGLEIEIDEGVLALRFEGKIVPLDNRRLVEAVERSPSVLSCVRHGDLLFLSIVGKVVDDGWDLYCFDDKAGKERWSVKGWGGGGAWWNRGALCVNETSVILFGIGQDGAYIEAFHPEDGRVQCRFSSSYWGQTDQRSSAINFLR